tara:strand:+ start:4986 stop:5444 length:459 start_codon:yes stop_codon:yes gene_type:complete
MRKYLLHFRDGKNKYHEHTYQKSLKDAIDEGNEMSSNSYHTFIKANFLSEKRSNKKTMARKTTYKKMVNKASSKRKNTQTGTAMSTKKYKLVMMKKSANKPMKSGIKFTSASGDAVNKMITAFRKKCGCAIKWQLYTYRSSLKAYRLSKASR